MPFSSLQDNSHRLNISIPSPQSIFHHRRRGDSPDSHDDTLPLSQDEHSNNAKYIKRGNRSTNKNVLTGIAVLLACTFAFTTSMRKSSGFSAGVEQYDAVIVGAGWTGISAAKALIEEGVDNILVLEANDYIGGRSKSVNLDGSINNPAMHGNYTNVPIEMGSEWLYPETDLSGNLISGGFLKRADIKDAHFVPLKNSPFYLQTLVDEATGENVTSTLKTELMEDKKAKDLYNRVWNGFSTYAEKYESALGDESDGSYGDAAEKYKAEKLTNDLDARFIDLAMSAFEVDYTGDRNELSIHGDTLDSDSIPAHYMSVPGLGYGNTAAKFAVPIAHKIQLNSKVTEIDFRKPNNAIISFSKNGAERKVRAKTILVTVSLGVLKAGTIKFTPGLPKWKRKVIQGMGFGLLNKCVLQWNDPNAAVWPEEEWIELITPRTENRDSGKWTTFFNPTSFKGVPILVGWAAAENARHMEAQTDEEVVADVMERLKAMFPTITPPDRHVITRWGSEENIHGTYSFKIVGRDFDEDSRQLRRPVENVWFAGEAAGGFWYGTVNGAYGSGEESAKAMLEFLSARSRCSFMSKLFTFDFSFSRRR